MESEEETVITVQFKSLRGHMSKRSVDKMNIFPLVSLRVLRVP